MPEKHKLSDVCIGLIGPLPPVRGGMSLYVQRLANRLHAAGLRVVVLATGDGREVLPGVTVRRVKLGRTLAAQCGQIAWEERIDLLHFHTFGCSWKDLLPFVALRRLGGVPVMASQHSFLNDVDLMAPKDRKLLQMCVQRMSRVVTSGPTVYDKLLQVGVHPEKLAPVVPFLAPSSQELNWHPWPEDVLAVRKRRGPVIASGTGRLVMASGRDLYGLDVFIQAAHQVLQALPDAAFVYVIGAPGNEELLQWAHTYVRNHGLQDSVCVHLGELPGPAMWQAADIFVRPTIDDGDAVSIREAMYLGVPTIASDAVGRPAGCQTYRCGEPADLAQALIAMATDLPKQRAIVAAHRPDEGFEAILDIYQQTLETLPRRERLRRTVMRKLLVGQGNRDRPGVQA